MVMYDEALEVGECYLDSRVQCRVLEYGRDEFDRPITGRGMFACADIPADTIIEVAPVVPIYKGEHWRGTNALYSYIFAWDVRDVDGSQVVTGASCLGYGAVYNHAEVPNTETERLMDRYLLVFRTTRDVRAGEELTHDYGWGEGDDLGARLNHIDCFMRPIPSDGGATPQDDDLFGLEDE